jgi:hypothetical protein
MDIWRWRVSQWTNHSQTRTAHPNNKQPKQHNFFNDELMKCVLMLHAVVFADSKSNRVGRRPRSRSLVLEAQFLPKILMLFLPMIIDL